MKRRITALTSVLMAAAMLTGCSDGGMMMDAAENSYAGGMDGGNYAAADSVQGVRPNADYAGNEMGVIEHDYNTEEYNSIVENSYRSVAAEPLSTFSIDVDTASYTNLRRMINEGWDIVPDAIRIEEMINYFNYDYSEPNEGEPFSVTTELTDCPWNEDTQLMLIGLQAEEVDMSDRAPMNLVFLIDVSGSMYSDNKLPLVQKSFTLLTENLTAQDRISIVTYAGEDKVVLEGADGNDQAAVLEAINELTAGGSTAGAAGITTAYKIAEKYFISGGNNRIILATDGDLNVGISSEAELTDLVEEKRESGVFLSVLGFGSGNIKDNKMEALADNGNGNYAYIDSLLEAKRVLVEEMGGTLVTVAKDVKIQVEFNPAYIKGYRLVGYENRMLAAEDFEDDTKDAGEIGAGHSVTALYEVVPVDSPMELTSADLKYESGEAAGIENGELLTVALRYKEPDGDESKLLEYPVEEAAYSSEMSDNLAFAAAVAEFGLVLRESEYKGTADCESVLELLAQCDYANDIYKTEFEQLVEEMQGRGY